MKRGKIMVAVTNDLVTDNRVDKVCTFLLNQGFEVELIGRRLKTSLNLATRAYKCRRMNLFFTKGALFYAEYNLRLFLLLLFRRHQHVLANDLDTLLAAFLVSRIKKTRLYYDSHELYTEVPELIHRPRVKSIWEKIEGFTVPKVKKVYTVNQAIADHYNKKYDQNFQVVRNISKKWQPQNIKSKESLGLPIDKKILIVQGAGINVDRGNEELIEAMPKIDESIVLIIVGSGDVIQQLKFSVQQLNLGSRVLFFDKRPYSELMEFTFHADWGLSLDKDTNMNYRFSLPNKIFDFIHAGTPIICTRLIEVAKIVEGHRVGVFVPKVSPDDIANVVNHYVLNENLTLDLKANCKAASEILCWEHEEEILKKIYDLD